MYVQCMIASHLELIDDLQRPLILSRKNQIALILHDDKLWPYIIVRNIADSRHDITRTDRTAHDEERNVVEDGNRANGDLGKSRLVEDDPLGCSLP
ncbi:hypothetical protein PsYK624_115990 [Phanerochaete sordida]|uniref:Uncharacterized protein n=1 Tax=Phanerochaete sordida TaxID=48140 RepID=A0A9P3GKX4_9APHY|nr:hypothetical protein PsYK624_115990 [Phanerochaete sordida]